MRRMKSIFFTVFVFAVFTFFATANGQTEGQSGDSQEFDPGKTMTIVVPFGVGGALDSRARIVGKYLEKELGITVIVENIKGAGGIVGTTQYMNDKSRGPIDMFFSGATIVTLAPEFTQVGYDPEMIKPIASVDEELFGLYACPEKTGITDFESLIDFGKSQQVQFGSGGPGNITHILQDALYKEAGIDAVTIPHGGAVEGLTNLLGGHVDVTLAGVALAKGYVEDGAIVPIAVYGKEDYTGYADIGYPSVPTVVSKGYDYPYLSLMFFGGSEEADPRGIELLHNAIEKVYQNPECIADLKAIGTDPIRSHSIEEMDSWLENEKTFMKRLIDISAN